MPRGALLEPELLPLLLNPPLLPPALLLGVVLLLKVLEELVPLFKLPNEFELLLNVCLIRLPKVLRLAVV